MNKYLEFWTWFNNIENKFFDSIEQEADKWVPIIDDALKKIHPDIVFEISELLQDKREIIISADGNLNAFEEVFNLCNASLVNDRWRVVALRQPEGVMNHHVELDGLVLGYEHIFYHLNNSTMYIYIEGYDHRDQRYVHAYFLLLDALIGEYDAVTQIKSTKILTERHNNLVPFTHLIEEIKKESTKS